MSQLAIATTHAPPSRFSVFLGLDPGASGGIAAIGRDGNWLGWIVGDATDADLLGFIRSWPHLGTFAVLEEVAATPRPVKGPGGERIGLAKMGAKSAFTFGGSYARLAMALVACGIPFERVLPRAWQTAMRCRTGGDKNVSKRRAQELFPAVKVTLKNADALLLAEHARRMKTTGDGP